MLQLTRLVSFLCLPLLTSDSIQCNMLTCSVVLVQNWLNCVGTKWCWITNESVCWKTPASLPLTGYSSVKCFVEGRNYLFSNTLLKSILMYSIIATFSYVNVSWQLCLRGKHQQIQTIYTFYSKLVFSTLVIYTSNLQFIQRLINSANREKI